MGGWWPADLTRSRRPGGPGPGLSVGEPGDLTQTARGEVKPGHVSLGKLQPVVLLLELEEPDEPPMFGHGWLVVLVDPLDDGTVVVEWLVVAALATAKPTAMLRPKAPPAKARVVNGLLSFILFVLSSCGPGDHPTTPTLEFAQTEVGGFRALGQSRPALDSGNQVVVPSEGAAAFTLDEIPGNTTELALVEHTTDSHGRTPRRSDRIVR